MLYVYALTNGLGELDSFGPGIEEEASICVAAGGVAAVCTRHAQVPSAMPENVLRHERVIERVMERTTVLPCRFGSTFTGESALRAVLARNEGTLLEALERVRDQVELGLRVLWTADAPPSTTPSEASSGRQYMLARLAEERQRERVEQRAALLADAIEQPLLECCTDHSRGAVAAGEVLFKGAYLVPRRRLEEFRLRVREAAQRHPDLRLLCTGPWPPYHFVPALSPAEVPRVAAS